jgi:hypothetical protein
MRIIILLWAAGSVITVGAAAFSGEFPDGPAEAAYANGKTSFAEQRYVDSADSFRKAYELKPSWKILYNIGQAETAAKRYGPALEAFEQYLAEGGDEVDAARQDTVLKEIERLRNLVGYVHINAPSGATVSIDGLTYGVAPINREIPVAATVQHVVKATQNDAVLYEQTVEVNGGRTVNLDLTASTPTVTASSSPAETAAQTEPVAENPPPTNSSAPKNAATQKPKSRMSKLKLAGIITASAGAALLIGGAVTGGMALSKNGDLEDNCKGGSCPSGYDLNTQDQRDTLALATDILIPTGAAAAAAGVVLVIVDVMKNKKEREKPTVWIRPVISPNNAGLAFEGRF